MTNENVNETDGLVEARAGLADLLLKIECCEFLPISDVRALPVTNAGWVYLVRAKGTPFIKVGYTGGELPHERIAQLQTASPHELVLIASFNGSQQEESELHRTLAARRQRGEWFQLSDDEATTIMWAGWYGQGIVSCLKCPTIVTQGDGLCWPCEKREIDQSAARFHAAGAGAAANEAPQ